MSEGVRIEMIDGDVWLIDGFITRARADGALATLISDVDWEQHRIRIHGREVASPRLSAWYGDPGARYSYSGLSLSPKPWLAAISDIRARIEPIANTRFNSALLNLYRDGRDSMGWHSDDEPELGDEPVIASVSLGAPRRIRLKHRLRAELPPVALTLTHGSLLIMRGRTQACWKHQVPKTRQIHEPRVNLTYRWVNPVGESD